MRLFLVTVFGALVLASAASAHPGGIWFQDAKSATIAVEAKYKLDVFRNCFGSALGHKHVDNYGGATFDHFLCLVDSQVPPYRTCWVTEHITGGQWYDIVLTSSKPDTARGYPGCGPYDIRKR